MSRRIAETDCADDYLLVAADQLGRLLHADDVLWVDTDFPGRSFGVWRASADGRDPTVEEAMPDLFEHPAIQSYLQAPGDLTPRRVADLSDFGLPGQRTALRLSQEVMGLRQLSMVIDVDPAGRGRGWIVIRHSADFGDDELLTAASLMPLLIAFDHRYRRRTGRQPELNADGSGVPAAGAETPLSAREQQVVDLLARGLTAHAIGRALGISPRTVGKHLEHIYAKVGHHDRLMVALQATHPERRAAPALI